MRQLIMYLSAQATLRFAAGALNLFVRHGGEWVDEDASLLVAASLQRDSHVFFASNVTDYTYHWPIVSTITDTSGIL